MSGALLQTAGQVRNSFPYIVRKSVLNEGLAVISDVPAIVPYSISPITEQLDLPFDYGPDKAGRVYITINGFSVILIAVTYAAAGVIAGDFYFLDNAGIEYHLMSVGDTLPNATSYQTDRILGIYTPLFTDKPGVIGNLVWRNRGSVLSTLNDVFASCNLNIGYYGDYAEYDFNNLEHCVHHHYYSNDGKSEVDTTKV